MKNHYWIQPNRFNETEFEVYTSGEIHPLHCDSSSFVGSFATKEEADHWISSNNHQAKDGFTGTLTIGDRLFPESIDLGLGNYVTADNIDELTSIFSSEPVHFVNII